MYRADLQFQLYCAGPEHTLTGYLGGFTTSRWIALGYLPQTQTDWSGVGFVVFLV